MKGQKRRGRRRITALGAALLLLAAASLVVLGAGAFRLITLKRNLDDGARQAEIRLIRAVPEQQIRVEDGRESADAVGMLTFFEDPRTATPVYYGTDTASLEKGAGQAEDTAPLNTPGNAVLFGHRDSAFRPMAELEKGDTLTLTTAGRTCRYQVERIYITDPEDPHIYDETEDTTLTLVTCYPFSFVGPAPERCVAVAKTA